MSSPCNGKCKLDDAGVCEGCGRTAKEIESHGRPACWTCGGPVQDIRGKLSCLFCGQINEGCCEGGRCTF